MGTPSQRYLLPSMFAMALVVASPASVMGQTSSARPATVSFTVVVPSRLGPGASLITDDRATVLHRGATTLDVETMIGLAERPASRIEVRLGRGWANDSAHVLVRNRNGQFEPLDNGARVIALDAPASFGRMRTPMQFRVASTQPVPATIAIPIEYRITVGTADQIAIYTYPSVIHLGASQ